MTPPDRRPPPPPPATTPGAPRAAPIIPQYEGPGLQQPGRRFYRTDMLSMGVVIPAIIHIVLLLVSAVPGIMVIAGVTELPPAVTIASFYSRLLQEVAFCAAATFLCIWTYQVVSNAGLFVSSFTRSASLAVASWFIPVMWWYWPFHVLHETWKASDPRARPGSNWGPRKDSMTLLLWWGVWTAAGGVSFLCGLSTIKCYFVCGPPTRADQAHQMVMSSAIQLAQAFATLMMILFVRALSARQREKIAAAH